MRNLAPCEDCDLPTFLTDFTGNPKCKECNTYRLNDIALNNAAYYRAAAEDIGL